MTHYQKYIKCLTIFFIGSLLFFGISKNSKSQCLDKVAFKPGEILNYDAVYNWGFIWINAGKVEFSASRSRFRGNDALYLKAYGTSLSSYDWFYKVRDLFESYITTDSYKPLYFNMDTHEGDFWAKNKYLYDLNQNLAYIQTENADREFKKDTLEISQCTYDVLSLIYFARSLNFEGLKTGDKISYQAIVDNEVFDLFIRYLGKEKIKLKNDKEYSCIKFSALLVEGTIFKGGEDLVVWATDDENRVPVQVEAKILVGSVKAVLTDAKGTLSPLKYIDHSKN